MNPTSFILSDPELIKAVRNGDISAFAILYGRHADAAYRLARLLRRDADEVQRLVSDSFAKVRAALLAGSGPTVIFRTYLLTTMRCIRHDQIRRNRGVSIAPEAVGTATVLGVLAAISLPASTESLVARALARLPARWQLVLWHLEVEREPPVLVGAMVGLVPSEVSTLGARSRERLRVAYLREMGERAGNDDCAWAAQHVGAGVSEHPLDPDRVRLDQHIAECGRCRRLFAELEQLGHDLPGVLAPLVLGALARGYCTAGRGVPGATATATARRRRPSRRLPTSPWCWLPP